MSSTIDRDVQFREEALPHMDAVYRFALRLARDPDRAEDLAQETFLRAYQRWDTYTPGTRAKSWLFTICRNRFLRREERSRRHSEIVSEISEEDPRHISREAGVFMAAQDYDPEGTFWRQLVDEEVLRAVDELPAEFREAVVLSDLEELSYEEIAGILGVPLGTVKSRLYRGRRMLQKTLYEYAVASGLIRPGSRGMSAEGGGTTG